MRRRSLAALAATAAAAVFAFIPVTASAAPDPGPLEAAGFLVNGEVDGAAVAEAAEQIPVAAPVDGYERDQFNHWSDPDGNGCDARNDMLQRDLDDITLRQGSNCIVESGTLHDPYTGRTIDFTRGVGTSTAVQIDHIVPLSYAWQAGAADWSDAQREAFANDPHNLIAVDGPTNGSKSDSLTGEWMPPNQEFHCEYIAHVTYVMTQYELAFTSVDDQEAILETAADCVTGSQTATSTPTPTDVPAPTPTESSTPTPEPTQETTAPAPTTTDPTDTEPVTAEPIATEPVATETATEGPTPSPTETATTQAPTPTATEPATTGTEPATPAPTDESQEPTEPEPIDGTTTPAPEPTDTTPPTNTPTPTTTEPVTTETATTEPTTTIDETDHNPTDTSAPPAPTVDSLDNPHPTHPPIGYEDGAAPDGSGIGGYKQHHPADSPLADGPLASTGADSGALTIASVAVLLTTCGALLALRAYRYEQ